ncbi:hypothetical protein ANN_27733 [Periplaneta americana]|uniref:Uncharacterized protein n=1 Tax=Periplaneta americana TaxID=6978 RepID=A0ABQ8RV37_PERAM|nr:hypothetical protein ANN_27733 [Periplaneta americana]
MVADAPPVVVTDHNTGNQVAAESRGRRCSRDPDQLKWTIRQRRRNCDKDYTAGKGLSGPAKSVPANTPCCKMCTFGVLFNLVLLRDLAKEMVLQMLKASASNIFQEFKAKISKDSCTGQNRNIQMSLSLMNLSQDPNMEVSDIDNKFLIWALLLPNDSDFDLIEKVSRKISHIFTPTDWMNIVQQSNKTHQKLEVIVMEKSDFYSTKTLEDSLTNRKKTIDGYYVN